MARTNKSEITALLAAISVTSGVLATAAQPASAAKSLSKGNSMFLADEKASGKTAQGPGKNSGKGCNYPCGCHYGAQDRSLKLDKKSKSGGDDSSKKSDK